MNSKAGIKGILPTILLFGILLFVFLFATVGLKQMYSENIIAPVITAALTASPTLDVGTVATINGFQTWWDLDWFNFDLFFIIGFLGIFASTIFAAYKAKKEGILSFFGLISIGSWAFLLILSFVKQISDFLILNFYTNLFDLTLVSTPIIDFFLNNINIVSFIWFLVIILVNQIDFQDVLQRIDSSNDGRSEQ